MKNLEDKYWFHNMSKYVTKYVETCVRCLFNKKQKGRREGFLHPIKKTETPFQTIHVDHLGSLSKSVRGAKYIFAVIDAFTKFILLCATKTTCSRPVLKLLDKIFEVYGVPQRIISDRGSAFTSKAFKDFCAKYITWHMC